MSHNQQSQILDSLQVTQTLVSPTGLALRTATPSLNPRDAAIAFNNTTKRLAYGANNVWKGIVDGPTVSVPTRLATFQSTDGQTIQDNTTITANNGDLNGVTNINGIAIANIVTNVTVGAVVSDSIPTFDGTTGRIIKGINSILIDAANNITNVNSINGTSMADFVRNITVGVVTANSVPTFDGTTGRIIKGGNSVLIDNSNNISAVNTMTMTGTANIAGLVTLNGTGVIVPQPFGAAPNANGMSVSANPGQQLTLQPASTTFPGGVTTIGQSFAGLKDFSTSGITVQPLPVSAGVATILNNYCFANALPFLWTGAFAVPVAATVDLERIGRTIFVKFLSNVNPGPGNMAVGIMTSTTAVVPVEFRPASDRLSSITIINGSTGGAGNAIQPGFMYLRSTGFLEIGIAINNAGTLSPFGAVSLGSGNGYEQGTQVFAE